MMKLILALCLFAAVELASSEKMLKMMEEAGVESDSSQQDLDVSSHRDKKLQASSADANTERQSGDNYPTSCGYSPPSNALKAVRDAFHIYSDAGQRRDYIINSISNVNGAIMIWHGIGKTQWHWARGNYWCVDFQGYEIWMT